MQRKNEGDIALMTFLSETEAQALAQFVKRVYHEDARRCSSSPEEAEQMLHACNARSKSQAMRLNNRRTITNQLAYNGSATLTNHP